jgi:hypothetical protein
LEKDCVGPVSIFFRKRSQVPRTKPTSKNPTKTKLQDEQRP